MGVTSVPISDSVDRSFPVSVQTIKTSAGHGSDRLDFQCFTMGGHG